MSSHGFESIKLSLYNEEVGWIDLRFQNHNLNVWPVESEEHNFVTQGLI